MCKYYRLVYDNLLTNVPDMAYLYKHDGRISDVIMGAMASQITGEFKENIKAPRHWPLCGEFTDDRWIPLTNSQ